jgi:hypothetical protein
VRGRSWRTAVVVAATLALAGCGHEYGVDDYVKDWEAAGSVDVEVKSCTKIGKAPYDAYDVDVLPEDLGEVWKCSVNETASRYGFKDRCYVVTHGVAPGVARSLACSLVADAS